MVPRLRGSLEVIALVAREPASADEDDGQPGQRGDGDGGAVVAQGQAFVGQQPAQRALDHPAMPAQALAGVHADAGDPGGDPAAAQVAADAGVVVALVAVQLGRSAPGVAAAAALDRRHRVQQWFDEHAVMPVGRRDQHVERQPVGVDEQVVLAAGLAPIGRVGPGQLTPLFARTLTESRLARDQSSRPLSPRRSSTVWWTRSKTPASAHSCIRRQQVQPDP